MPPFTIAFKPAFIIILFFLCSSICIAQNTTLYGLVNEGGSNDDGVIIRFSTTTNKDSVVWNFGNSDTDGINSYGDLAYDSNNDLFYGMTTQGGKASGGTIFSFDPINNNETVAWNLGASTDGQFPWGDLVYDTVNNLFYGMTSWGGKYDLGTIFRFDPSDNAESVIWSFGSGTDGQHPAGDLVYNASNNMFYGMTYGGGSNGLGTIFKFDPNTDKDSVLWNFAGQPSDAAYPYGNLTYDANLGIFYGMTSAGGNENVGTIISFNPSNIAESMVWSLGGALDGYNPEGSLVYDAVNGLFYGMTIQGGTHGSSNINIGGTIISFNPNGNKEKVVWNFGNSGDGLNPYGNLVYDAGSGLFYGMTYDGGSAGYGTIISFNPSNNSENVLWNFRSASNTDGYFPQGSLVIYDPTAGINQLAANNNQLSIYPNPTSGQFTISGLKNGQAIEVYNYLGQQISSTIAKKTTHQTDLSSQVNGIYLIEIRNENGTIEDEKKIVKIN